MPITINGSGTITGAATLATTVVSPTLTTPNINSAQFATVTGTAPIYPCRAWVNFDGTGTVAIRASGNVTSITDNGTGDYTVNFTTAMPDTSYAWVGSSTNPGAATNSFMWGYSTATYLSGSVRIGILQAGSSFIDAAVANVAIFR
jgi:hypothetical protein